MNDITTVDFIIIAIIAFVTGILFRRWVRARANKRKPK
jgi:membrane protein implicated in regulation of membrane protease activity